MIKRLLLTLLSAGLLWASFPPLAFAPAAWVALAPLLWALEGASPRLGMRLGFLWGFLFFAGATSWLGKVFGASCAGVWGFEALFGAFFGLLIALVGRRGTMWHLLGVPALWVGIEWLRMEGNPLRFGWFALGLSQTSSCGLLQVADLAGVYGLSFLLAFTASAVARRTRWSLGGAVLALVAAASYHGIEASSARIPVAVVQGEDIRSEDYARMTLGLAGDPRLVVWPELSLTSDPAKAPAEMEKLRALARTRKAALVIGCPIGDPGEKGWQNRALVLGPEGETLGEYVKHVPIQFFHDGLAGKGYPVFQTPAGRLGVCICYDQDFPWVTRGLVQAGAEVLAIPTMDLASWGPLQHRQHTVNARFRAVEHRRYVVRACSSGISQVIAPDGRIEAEVADTGEGAAVGMVSPSNQLTLYDRGGWLLGPACVGWLTWVILSLLVRRRPC